MSSNRKYFPHNAVIFVTTRTEENLPIVCSHIMNFIIWGILARARSMYRVKICHFVFMSNHFHMILVVDCPQDIPNFMGYVKGEISHAINRLLGRRQKTIWQDGYDSPILLTVDDVSKYIKYIYKNPSKARLVHSIDDYPGVSSWEMFKNGKLTKVCKKLSRDLIPLLYSQSLGINEQKRIVEKIEKLDLNKYEFILEPCAWREAFSGVATETDNELIDQIKKEEDTLKSERIKFNIEVIGSTNLRRESMLKEYRPKKYTKRMICISCDISLRKTFIEVYKVFTYLACKAYSSWKRGDYTAIIPPGMFSPRRPEFASLMSIY